MRRLYGDLREAYGYTGPQIDAMSMEEVEDVLEHWKEKPTVGDMLRSYFGIETAAAETASPVDSSSTEPQIVTQEQLDRIIASTKAVAERSRKSPFG